MFTQWPPLDDKEERKNAIIQRKAEYYVDRRDRVLQSKQRMIGIDVQYLDQQCREKQQRDQDEREYNDNYEAFEKDVGTMMKSIAEREKRARKDAHLDLTHIWEQQKNRKARPEADINFPDKTLIPYEEMGPASIQVFEGYRSKDQMKERKRYLQKQQEVALLRQESERQRIAQAKNDEHRAFAAIEKRQVEIRLREEMHHKQQRKDNNVLYAEWNKRISQEKEDARKRAKEEFEKEAEKEHQSTLSSSLLLESRSKGISDAGSRIVRSEWKGMTPNQLADITKEQYLQQQERERQRQRDIELERDYARQQQYIKQVADDAHNEDVRRRSDENARVLAILGEQQEHKKLKEMEAKIEAQQHGFDNWWPFGRDCR